MAALFSTTFLGVMEERIHILYSFAKYLNFLEMLVRQSGKYPGQELLTELDALGVDTVPQAGPGMSRDIDPEGIELGQQFLSRIFA